MATPSRWDLQRARHRNRRGSRIRRRRNKRSPKSMRLIDAAVLTTDSVCFERIGDLKIQVHRDRGKEPADNRRFTLAANIEFTSATRKARGSAGRNLRKVRYVHTPT